MFQKKKSLNFLFLLMILVLGSVVFLSGCGQKQSPSEPEGPVEQQQVEFNVNLITPEQVNGPMQAFAQAVEERTGGKVKLNLYYSNSLLAIPDQITGLQTGVADISGIVVSGHVGSLPLNDMFGWPFMGYTDYKDVFSIQTKLLNDIPELGAEFSNLGLRVFAGWAMAPHQLLVASKKKVLSPDDLKGMKIISKLIPAEVVTKLGGTPVAIPVNDAYMSLERGIADAIILHPAGTMGFGVAQLSKQYVSFGEQGFTLEPHLYVISDKAWNKLTPETQMIFMEEAAKLNAGDAEVLRQTTEVAVGLLKQAGEITELTPEQVAEFAQYADGVHQNAVAELEKQGKPGQKVYDAIKKAIAESK